MSKSWFPSRLLPNGSPEDGCDPQEAAALKDYLLSTTTTAEATARRITIPVTDKPHTIRQGQCSNNLPRL